MLSGVDGLQKGDLYYNENLGLCEIVRMSLGPYGFVRDVTVLRDKEIKEVLCANNPLFKEENKILNRFELIGNSHYYAAMILINGRIKDVSRRAAISRGDDYEYVYMKDSSGLIGQNWYLTQVPMIFFKTREKYNSFEKWYWGREWASGCQTIFFDNSLIGRMVNEIENIRHYQTNIKEDTISGDLVKKSALAVIKESRKFLKETKDTSKKNVDFFQRVRKTFKGIEISCYCDENSTCGFHSFVQGLDRLNNSYETYLKEAACQ